MRIRRQFKLSDNDYNAMKGRLLQYIKEDMPSWFKYYGIEKTIWKRYLLRFDKMREDDIPKKEVVKGLTACGILCPWSLALLS